MVELGTSFELLEADLEREVPSALETFYAQSAQEQFEVILQRLRLPDPSLDVGSVLNGLDVEELLWVWLGIHIGLLDWALRSGDLEGTSFSANHVEMVLLEIGAPKTGFQ